MKHINKCPKLASFEPISGRKRALERRCSKAFKILAGAEGLEPSARGLGVAIKCSKLLIYMALLRGFKHIFNKSRVTFDALLMLLGILALLI